MLQNFSENFGKKNWQLKKERKLKLLIFMRPFLPYCANGSAVCLPFSIGNVRPYMVQPQYMAMVRVANYGDG